MSAINRRYPMRPWLQGETLRCKGVSLIEAMIALAVLSIGLAGIATMNMDSLRNAHASNNRSIASAIALDLEERLWLQAADNTRFGCPDVSADEGSLSSQLLADWARAAPTEDWAWTTAPQAQLPGLLIAMGTPVVGALTVEVPITLSWTEQRYIGDEAAGESFTYTVRVVCRPAAPE